MPADLLTRLDELAPGERSRLVQSILSAEEPANLPDEIWSACEEFSLLSAADRAQLPPDVVDAYPLTVSQLGMIAHSLADADVGLGSMPAAYHNVATIQFQFERFDEDAFRRSANLLVRRHPIFRTSFALTEYSQPLQLVHREAQARVDFIDLRSLDAAEQERELARMAAELNDQPVELADFPLIHFYVHRLTDTAIALTLVEPHAISDGWSTHLSLVDLVSAHNAVLQGRPEPSTEPPASAFRHFVAQQTAEIRSTADRQFWRSFGARLPATHRATAAVQLAETSSAHRREVYLAEDVVIGLKQLANAHGVSLKVVLLAVHLRALGQQQGLRRPLTGMTVNGRLAVPGGIDVRGMFLNIVPFATSIDGSWDELVRRVDEVEQQVSQHRRLPLALIIKEGGQHLAPSSMFVFNHFHSMSGVAAREGISTMEEVADWSRTNYELEASFNLSTEVGNQVLFILVNDLRYLEEAAADQYYESYLALLADAARAATAPQPQIELPAPVREFVADDLRIALRDSLIEHAKLPAVRHREDELSYAQLDLDSAEVARHLTQLGVGPGSRVGVLCAPSRDFITALVGVLRLGAVYVPLDVSHPVARRQFIVDDAELEVVLWDGHGEFDLQATAESLHCTHAHQPTEGYRTARVPVADRPDPVYVIYTSGSTGAPKGVEVAAAGLWNRLGWMQADFALSPADSVLQKTAVSFDVSVWELIWPLLHGARIVIADQEMRQEPEYLSRLIIDAGVSLCHFVPSVLARFITAPGVEKCTSLRHVVCSGEALPPRTVNGLQDLLPDVVVTNLYGPTECSIDVTGWRCERPEAGNTVPIGFAKPNCDLYVLDGQLAEVPDGTAGELCVGGVQVANGYLNRPEANAAAFVPNPFRPGTMLYRTGDLSRRRSDGAYEYLGRTDRQVKVNGVRLELEEVETVLRRQPDIHEAAVELVTASHGGQQLVGFVTMLPGADCQPSLILAAARRQLPAEATPARIVALDRFPITTTGKLDRAALGQLMPAPAPSVPTPVSKLTDTERLVGRVWCKVTGMKSVDFGADLYALGLDSIAAVLVVTALRGQRRSTSVAELMGSTTLRDYASRLDARTP
ncbi:MAG: amino acid adenylation domain-containing protein [Actinomycetota bacterium]|nr:amino acid adenylation domain-containing protein [Actinomycetota bacterium]MDQ2956662.1 amino acid adenylation domain-containing protein [Actinomycetota bacterium]